MLPEQGMYTITYGSRRDIGLVRQENQDQMVSFDSSVFGQVFLLADGMGGHEGGAIAANMAITGFKQHFQALATKLPLRDSLMEAARLTNLDIYEKSNEKDNGANALRMGSTLVACVVSGGSYVVVHAGDSRCYAFRNGVLTRLTKDHTAVQKMVDAGILTPDDAKNHPDASVLTRAFGQRPTIELEISEPQSLAVDEALLLCSDGLYGYVEEYAIAGTLQQNDDPQAAADALLQLALDAGGHDNISIFVIRAEPSSTKGITAPDPPMETVALPAQPLTAIPAPPPVAAPSRVEARNTSGRRLALCLMAAAVLVLAGLVTALLRPEIIPVRLRVKLAAWGIPLPSAPAPAADAGLPDSSQAQYKDRVARLAASVGKSAEAGGTATSGATVPSALAEGSAAPASAPVDQPPATSAGSLVILVFPPDSDAVFRHEVDSFATKLRDAGFEVSESQKPIERDGVWHSVSAVQPAFAADRIFLSPIYCPGLERDAARICLRLPCSQPGSPVPEGDRPMFERNFGAGGIAVFAYPGYRKAGGRSPAQAATSAGSLAATSSATHKRIE